MARGRCVLQEVDRDVARLWGSGASLDWQSDVHIDADDAFYTRANIRHWLLRWHEFSQLADHSLKWARTRADIGIAISQLSLTLQDFHELYCVIGYSQTEVEQIFEWQSDRTFSKTWGKLVNAICRRLMDRHINEIPRIEKEPTYEISEARQDPFYGACGGCKK